MAGGERVSFLQCRTPWACPVGAACLPSRHVPCVAAGSAYRTMLRLCDDLEALADGLPARVDRRRCLVVAGELVPLLRLSHAYEEDHLFPLFEGSGGAGAAARARTVRRLKTEHVEDECAAQDLTEVLFAVGHGARIDNPEALGFMLRGFFETMRRHIAFEREHLLPLTTVWEP